jgi:hypothetical protein
LGALLLKLDKCQANRNLSGLINCISPKCRIKEGIRRGEETRALWLETNLHVRQVEQLKKTKAENKSKKGGETEVGARRRRKSRGVEKCKEAGRRKMREVSVKRP